MNLPDLPEIWYAFQRGWHGSFTIFNALVIECFLYRSFKSGSSSPTLFPALLWIYFLFVLFCDVPSPTTNTKCNNTLNESLIELFENAFIHMKKLQLFKEEQPRVQFVA